MFSCEFYKMFKNTFLREHLKMTNQKHPFMGVLWKKCSERSKFTGELPCRSAVSIKLLSNLIEIARRYVRSPLNLLYIFRTAFPKNIPEGLLLTNFECSAGIAVRQVDGEVSW